MVSLESTSLPLCLQYGDLPLNYIFILSAILAAYMIANVSGRTVEVAREPFLQKLLEDQG